MLWGVLMKQIDWSLFQPTVRVLAIEETPLDWIWNNFKVILIDVDNTLVKHNSNIINSNKIRWIRALRERNNFDHTATKIALMTNNYNGTHIEMVADDIDADSVVKGRWPVFYKCWNPWVIADTLFRKPIRQTIEHFGVKPSEIAVFNDSYIIACAANMENVGASILVEPICRQSEKTSTLIQLGRLVEQKIIIPKLQELQVNQKQPGD